MGEHLGIVEILGIAGSVSLLAGWRLYLCVLATGLAMHYHLLPLPEHLKALQILGERWLLHRANAPDRRPIRSVLARPAGRPVSP